MIHYFKYLIIGILLITLSCQAEENRAKLVKTHKITKIIKVTPVSIHDEISPRFRAILSNGDTVSCTRNQSIGDPVNYVYYVKDSTNSSNLR